MRFQISMGFFYLIQLCYLALTHNLFSMLDLLNLFRGGQNLRSFS
jgi:hypothetical protein